MVTRVDWAPDWREQIYDLSREPLRRGADIVLDAMRDTIPVSTDGSHGRPAGYARAGLRTLNVGRDSDGPYRDVGTDATTPDGHSYPAMLHYGTRAHIIESHGPYPLRDSKGRVVGRPVLDASGRLLGWRVQHPGTKPTYWGTRAANTLNGRRL